MKRMIIFYYFLFFLWTIPIYSQNVSEGENSCPLIVSKPIRVDPPSIQKFLKDFRDDDILAYVNDLPVTFLNIRFWYTNMLANHANIYREIPLTDEIAKNFRKTALDKAILKQVLACEIKRLNLYPSEQEFENEYKKYKSRFPSEQDFINYLSFNGVPVERFKEEFRFQMEIDRLTSVFDKEAILPSKKEIKKWYKTHKDNFKIARQIRFLLILLINPDNSAETKKKNGDLIMRMRADIASGNKTFKFYAKNYSDHAKSRKKSGDYGMVSVDKLMDMFKPLINLPKNKLSPVYRYPDGFYIAKIIEEKPESTEKFSKAKEKIKNILTRLAIYKNRGKYIEGLRNKAVIKIVK